MAKDVANKWVRFWFRFRCRKQIPALTSASTAHRLAFPVDLSRLWGLKNQQFINPVPVKRGAVKARQARKNVEV